MSSRTKDRTGNKYGMLTAVRPVGRTAGHDIIWLFQCDCGNTVERPASRVASIAKTHRSSCGCYNPGKHIRVNPEGVVARRVAISHYRIRARKKGREFLLTDREIDDLFSGNCYYCGASPTNTTTAKGSLGSFTYNGIDRLNSSLGYITGNVVSCCPVCNRAKSDMLYEEFVSWARRVASCDLQLQGN